MTDKKRIQYKSSSILAKDTFISNDTWETGINNNVLVVGPSGAGKTRSYVKPNIMQANTNMIVSDAKGTLYRETAPLLRANGYEVWHLEKEPFWDVAARMYVSSVIAYVLEALPEEEHTLEYVNRVIAETGIRRYDQMMNEHELLCPNSFAVRRYREFCVMAEADKMTASVLGIAATNLSSFDFREAVDMYSRTPQVDFSAFSDRKIALFLTVSDTDRSQDRLVNLFWTQALQGLIAAADRSIGGRLAVPVRLYLDDFATNVYIPDFDKISSNIRSREIYVSVILQSVAQLEALYGTARASTIIGNCDQQLVLGVQDIHTAQLFAQRANKPASALLNMPLGECYLFVRGTPARKVFKYDITTHINYSRCDAEPSAPCRDVCTDNFEERMYE